jgi:hypothetical protein
MDRELEARAARVLGWTVDRIARTRECDLVDALNLCEPTPTPEKVVHLRVSGPITPRVLCNNNNIPHDVVSELIARSPTAEDITEFVKGIVERKNQCASRLVRKHAIDTAGMPADERSLLEQGISKDTARKASLHRILEQVKHTVDASIIRKHALLTVLQEADTDDVDHDGIHTSLVQRIEDLRGLRTTLDSTLSLESTLHTVYE